jgi:acetyl esterase/lipase
MNMVQAIPGRSIRVFSLDYSLVPEARYPTQIQQIATAYEYLLTKTSAEKIIVGGDSAGASLLLSFLLHLARPNPDIPPKALPAPASLILISPWVNIDSHLHTPKTTPSTAVIDEDFLNTGMLGEYARLYTGASTPRPRLPLVFPLQFCFVVLKGLCRQLLDPSTYSTKWITRAKLTVLEYQKKPDDLAIHTHLSASPYRNPFAALDHPKWLAEAIPANTLLIYGEKEIMVHDIRRFAEGIKDVCQDAGNGKNVQVVSRWRKGWHAWPLVLMYLGSCAKETDAGIDILAEFITRHHRK